MGFWADGLRSRSEPKVGVGWLVALICDSARAEFNGKNGGFWPVSG